MRGVRCLRIFFGFRIFHANLGCMTSYGVDPYLRRPIIMSVSFPRPRRMWYECHGVCQSTGGG